MRWFIGMAIVLITLLAFAACSTVTYYSQAIGGQLSLLHQRKPIQKLLARPDTDPALKARLDEVLSMRQFATNALALPDNGSYTGYAATGRSAVVWNVVATPPYSLAARTWCFPIAGCVPYRGYFHQQQAEKFAGKLRDEGLDVAILPATAYSTLGYFADPVLDTMLNYPGYQLAGLIFHELAHQQLYVKDDAGFNESFATTVERAGIRLWLDGQEDTGSLNAWRQQNQRAARFNELLSVTRSELDTLYGQIMPDQDKADGKATVFAALKQRYQSLKQEWDGHTGFDYWFDRPLNNAHLALHATYEAGVDRFEQLLTACDNDLPEFYSKVAMIAELEPSVRSAWLNMEPVGTDLNCTRVLSVRP